jgi:hypothetical protein
MTLTAEETPVYTREMFYAEQEQTYAGPRGDDRRLDIEVEDLYGQSRHYLQDYVLRRYGLRVSDDLVNILYDLSRAQVRHILSFHEPLEDFDEDDLDDDDDEEDDEEDDTGEGIEDEVAPQTTTAAQMDVNFTSWKHGTHVRAVDEFELQNAWNAWTTNDEETQRFLRDTYGVEATPSQVRRFRAVSRPELGRLLSHLSEPVSETMKVAEPETLESFKALVVKRISEEAKTRGWCSQVDDFLATLGLERVKKSWTVNWNVVLGQETFTIRTEVKGLTREDALNAAYTLRTDLFRTAASVNIVTFNEVVDA